jgi:uroporphyrinogen-III synthase
LSEPAALAGVRVMVTRPAHQAENLCRLIEAAGGTAVRLPLQTIEPASQPAEAQRRIRSGPDGYDTWIFTSVNAVRHAAPMIEQWAPRVVAIGPATADALAVAGAAEASTPLSGSSSEELLALPDFSDVHGRRILIVGGEGGREVLEAELAARGALVERAAVYRRVPLPYPPETLAAALRKSDVVVVTSAEALAHLLRLAPEAARASLLRKPLVVPSARVVEKARELGFTSTRLAAAVADAALCAACQPP